MSQYWHHIYLSYSHDDMSMMRQVRDSLLAAGITVWSDEGLKAAAELWVESILEAIDHSGAVLVLLSPRARSSQTVAREMRHAIASKKKIFGLIIEGHADVSIPTEIIDMRYMDICADPSKCDSELIPNICAYLGIHNLITLRQEIEAQALKLAQEWERLRAERGKYEAQQAQSSQRLAPNKSETQEAPPFEPGKGASGMREQKHIESSASTDVPADADSTADLSWLDDEPRLSAVPKQQAPQSTAAPPAMEPPETEEAFADLSWLDEDMSLPHSKKQEAFSPTLEYKHFEVEFDDLSWLDEDTHLPQAKKAQEPPPPMSADEVLDDFNEDDFDNLAWLDD